MDLVATHVNAGLNAVAAMVALDLLHGPMALAVPGGVDPAASQFLRDHGAELPTLLTGSALVRHLDRGPLGRLLVVDTASIQRLGVIGHYVERFAQVQAWANHPAADDDLPRAERVAAGACISALVLELAAAGRRPRHTEAGLFLVGIHQDTAHFTCASTTELDHRAAAQCCAWGAPTDWPARCVPRGFTRGRLAQAREPRATPTTLERQPPPRVVLAMASKQLDRRWPLLTALAELGSRCHSPVYLVGGSVRDVLLGAPIRDVDVLVEGDAPQLARRAAAELGGEAKVHEGFATARWYPGASGGDGNSHPIDLASARSEHYAAPAALPEVARASIEQDLCRRDFTINAMALGLSGAAAGRIVDPHGGLADLHDGVLRVLHGLSFHDDPTRAWRAARLAARLGFRVAADTLGLLRAARRTGAMDRLTLGRLGAEIEQVLDEREVVQAFRLLRQWQLNTVIHPEFDAQRPFLGRLAAMRSARFRVFELIAAMDPEVPRQSDVLWVVVAGCVPAADRADRLALVGGGKRRQRRWLHGPEHVARAVASVGRAAGQRPRIARALETLDPVELTAAVGSCDADGDREAILWWLGEGRTISSAINGRTLLELGYRQGPTIKRSLAAALDCARAGGDPAAQLRAARAVADAQTLTARDEPSLGPVQE